MAARRCHGISNHVISQVSTSHILTLMIFVERREGALPVVEAHCAAQTTEQSAMQLPRHHSAARAPTAPPPGAARSRVLRLRERGELAQQLLGGRRLALLGDDGEVGGRWRRRGDRLVEHLGQRRAERVARGRVAARERDATRLRVLVELPPPPPPRAVRREPPPRAWRGAGGRGGRGMGSASGGSAFRARWLGGARVAQRLGQLRCLPALLAAPR